MANILTKERFIEKSKIVHNNKYDYSLVEYKGTKTHVNIICPTHGVFSQKPNNHLIKYGCSLCGLERKTSNSEEFIKKAKEIHGDKYDYSKVVYKNIRTKIEIICPIHGSFFQYPTNHIHELNKNGCAKCVHDTLRDSLNDFILKSKNIHGDTYDYNLVDYTNNRSKVKIICDSHGVFEQKPDAHLRGDGCPKCKSSKGEIKIREYLIHNNINFE